MQIVTFPEALLDTYLADLRKLLQNGQVAESHYYREAATEYVPGRHSVPVSSGGTAFYTLLAYHHFEHKRNVAIVQSNTMRALYTVPKLVGMTPHVVDSSYEDMLAMNPEALEQALSDSALREQAVVLYSVIGGYLAPSFRQIVEICHRHKVPLIVDAAHGHYLDELLADPSVDIAYSFYATKILPAGEGGLITTANPEVEAWVRRFLMYDRFHNEFEVGLNLRAGEPTAALIWHLMTNSAAVDHFKTARIEVVQRMIAECKTHGIRYIDPDKAIGYNGYKLIVLDPFEKVEAFGGELTKYGQTSPVFGTDVRGGPTKLPHWCPPTYPSLRNKA